MTVFATPASWRVPTSALRLSLTEMAHDGRDGNEGVALWLGRRDESAVEVTHVVALRGSDVEKAPDLLRIGSQSMNDVTDLAIAHKAMLVGQIHSHGPRYGVNLSPTDRQYGISVPGYLSLVAPDYALRPGTKIIDCGVHLFEASIGWRWLRRDEVQRRITMTEGANVPLLIAGGENV